MVATSTIDRDTVKHLLAELRDKLLGIVDEVDRVLSEIERDEGPSTQLVAQDGTPLAKVYERENELTFKIYPSFHVGVGDATVKNFLEKKILDGFAPKGITYEITEADGCISTIVVRGKLEQGDIETLRRTIAWVILKTKPRGEAYGPQGKAK